MAAPAEIFELADELYEVRFDLGEPAFPDEESRIVSLVAKCKEASAMTHWRELKPYSEV